MLPVIIFYVLFFLYGIVIGSFLNVCIFRIPKKETIVTEPSHCMSCGHKLGWLDMVPLFSFLVLRGKCRYCGAKLSAQYPIVEGCNGLAYMLILYLYGFGDLKSTSTTILYCLMFSALLALSMIDFQTYEIPVGFNYFLLVLGIARVATDYRNWSLYVIGLFAVSIPLLLIYLLSKGRAIGGGDVKLMAACGLIIGWKLIIFAFLTGCILGSIIHVIRMKVSKANHVLAMGPYLSAGIVLAIAIGIPVLNWYTGLIGF